MLYRILVPLLLAACGTVSHQSPLPERPDPLPFKAFQCRVEERADQFCGELAKAQLSTSSGPIALVLKECEVDLSGGLVRWVNSSNPLDEYRVLVKLDRERLAERFVPAKFQRFQTQWPCSDCGATDEATLNIPLAQTCLRRGVGGSTPVQVRTFAIEPTSSSNCPSGLHRFGRDGWCERMLEPGTERYDVRAWWVFTPMVEGHILVGPNSIRWRGRFTPEHPWLEGRLDDSEQVDPIRRQLAELWAMPPEAQAESCRDGGLRLVAARRRDEWRVVQRFCADPGGLTRLLQSWILEPSKPSPPSRNSAGPANNPTNADKGP